LTKRTLNKTAEFLPKGDALKVLELYAVKMARTVLRGRKLPGTAIN
jgi:hypothetical protein